MKRRHTYQKVRPTRPREQQGKIETTNAAVVTSNMEESSDDLEMDEDINIEPILRNAKKSKLLEEISRLKTEHKVLSTMLSQRRKVLTYEALVLEPKMFFYYTGMQPNIFRGFYLGFDESDFNYFHGWKVESLDKPNQLLLFLIKLRWNFTYEDLAYRFDVSPDLVENVFLTWLHTVHKRWFIGQTCKLGIPSREVNQKYLPSIFKDYPDCRIILDYLELDVERLVESSMFGNFYDHCVVKALLGIMPNGCVTFASNLYPSTKSMKEIVIDSKVLDQMVPGDCILADEIFLPIRDILPPGVTLNTSPFLNSRKDQNLEEEKEILSVHTLLNIVMNNIDLYKILDLIPAQLEDFATMIWQVCFAFQMHVGPLFSRMKE